MKAAFFFANLLALWPIGRSLGQHAPRACEGDRRFQD